MSTAVLHWSTSHLSLIVPVCLLIVLTAYAGLLTPKTAEALDNEEQTFLGTINDYRAQHGLGALTESPALDGVAGWMASDMATHNYFSHTDSTGRDPFARMDQMGYGYNTWRGENLVAGTETSANSFYMWSTSPPHNENMLGEHYTVIGIARAYDSTSSFGWYWATEFGGESDAVPAPTPAPEPQPVVPTPAPAPPPQAATPAPSPTPTPPHPSRTAPAGLVFEGDPPFVTAARGGSFISALLELAPAVDRAFDRAAVRAVH